MLAIPVILGLLALIAWLTVEPHLRRCLRRAAQKRRHDNRD